MSTPNSTVYLLSGVPLDNRYENTLDFNSAQAQLDYFLTFPRYEFNDYTYIRKNNSIRVARSYDSTRNTNYVMYKNEGGKWIYAFIIDHVYINDNTTEVIIEEDVMQTNMFDYTIMPSFVLREHQDRWYKDSFEPRFSLTEEDIEYGSDYVRVREEAIEPDDGIIWFLAVATENIETGGALSQTVVNNAPSPFYYYLIPYFIDGSSTALYNTSGNALMKAQDFCRLIADKQSIVSCSYIPFLPFSYTLEEYQIGYKISFGSAPVTVVKYSWNDGQSDYHVLTLNGNIESSTKQLGVTLNRVDYVGHPTQFAPARTRNSLLYESKLLTHPYTYNLLTDWKSEPVVYKNEFLPDVIKIKGVQNLSHDMKTKYYIENYKGDEKGKDNAVINQTANSLPLTSDAYLNYMTANAHQTKTQLAMAAVQGAIGGIYGGTAGVVGGAIASTAGTILSEVAKRKDLKNIPDTVRNLGNNISFDLADENVNLCFVMYSLPDTVLKRVGDYFAMYGYKCNELKVPNLKSRYYYNYIRTAGCNIKGNISRNDINKIAAIYDKGITVWHMSNANVTPLDYKYDNVEMSLL